MKESEIDGIYIGFDISTSRIGVSIADSSHNLIEMKCIELKIDTDVLLEHKLLAKANIFKEYLQKYKSIPILGLLIEDPLQGSNNQFTSNMLMQFNGICSYILYTEFNVLPEFLTVYDWRRHLCPEFLTNKKGNLVHSFPKNVDKKIYILEKISKLYPNIVWEMKKTGSHKDGNFDMADAVGLLLGYFIKHNKFKLSN